VVMGALSTPAWATYLSMPFLFFGYRVLRSSPPLAFGERIRYSHILKGIGYVIAGLAFGQPLPIAPARISGWPADRSHPAQLLEKIQPTELVTSETTGIYRIMRHPFLVSLSMIGAGNAIIATSPATWTLWALCPVFAAIYGAQQDVRLHFDDHPETATYLRETSIVPFAGILSGKQSLSKAISELSLGRAFCFLAFYTGFHYAKPRIDAPLSNVLTFIFMKKKRFSGQKKGGAPTT